MARGIKLRRYQIQDANHYYLRGFRLKVDVEEVSGGMDPNVFLFRRRPADPWTGIVYDEYMTVCSFVDMSWYPVGEPDLSTGQPFFRNSVVELDLRSHSDFEYAWNVFREQVTLLCALMDRADTLVVTDTVWLGEAPEGAHVSESDSVSYSGRG